MDRSRSNGALALSLAGFCLLSGCPDKGPPQRASPAAPDDRPAPREARGELAAPPQQAPPLTPDDRQERAAPPGPVDPADTEGPLHDFAGFSRDESRYASTIFSEAAGLHLLTVVEGNKGEVKHRFQLIDEPATDEARAFLRAHGFSRRSGELPAGVQEGLQLRVRGGKAHVTLRKDGQERVLYEGDPFATPGLVGGVARVELAKVSPSGRRIAVRVEQVPVTEWGGITGHILLDVEPEP